MKRRPKSLLFLIVLLAIGGFVAVLVAAMGDAPQEAANTPAANNAADASAGTAESIDENEQNVGTTQYADTEFGFMLNHPASWQLEKNDSGAGETRIINYVFQDNGTGITLVVVPEGLEGIIRESVSVEKEETVSIHGRTATKITGRQEKNGTRLDLLLFNNDGMVFALNGTPDVVEQVGQTFRFN